jgi:hypothetical protein
MKTFKAYWKIEPIIKTKEQDYPTEQEILDCLMDITTEPHDYIEFEEVKKEDINRYEKAFNILMKYFDSINDEEKPKVDKQLKKLGL